MLAESTRTYLPIDNVLGFGAADLVEFALAATALAIVFSRVWLGQWAARVAANTSRSMWLAGGLAFLLRVLLLPAHPVPIPSSAEDFSYLLLGDTIAHGRLANPVHPLHEFFEAVAVLQTPSYSSILPLGQGLVLASGKLLFGEPWVGVLVAESLLCALCYWMLRGWLKPLWALAGGLLAVAEFGPLSPWMNGYSGGAVAGMAGCLVFGSLPRWRATKQTRWALAAGVGLGLHFLARPFETLLVAASVGMFLLWERTPGTSAASESRRLSPEASPAVARQIVEAAGAAIQSLRRHWKPAAYALAGLLAAGVLVVFENERVTGNWMETPAQLSRYQYGVPASFTFQANAVPHNALTALQRADYDAQTALHGNGDNAARFWQRLGYRLRFLRFFLYPPLYLAALACLWRLKNKDVRWAWGTIVLFAVGTIFCPTFRVQDVAALTSVFLLVAVTGLEQIWEWGWRGVRWGPLASGLLLALCMARFVFWFGLHLAGSAPAILALGPYETWDYLNDGDPEGRGRVERELAGRPGKQLVFVRHANAQLRQEWVQNEASIDQSRVVRALDLGPEENQKLRQYFPDRTVWLLEPDIWPPKLSAFPKEAEPPVEMVKPGAQPADAGKKKGQRVSDWLENVK